MDKPSDWVVLTQWFGEMFNPTFCVVWFNSTIAYKLLYFLCNMNPQLAIIN